MSGRMKDEDARKDCLFKDPVELEKGSTSIKLSKNEIGIWSTLHTLSALFYSHAPPIPHPNTQNSPDPLLLDTEKEKSGGVDDIHSGDESMLNNSSSWYHRSKNPFVLELLPCYNPPTGLAICPKRDIKEWQFFIMDYHFCTIFSCSKTKGPCFCFCPPPRNRTCQICCLFSIHGQSFLQLDHCFMF